MTNKRIQLSTNVDGQNVNVYPVTKSEFVEFSDGKTLNDKLNNMDGNHEHGLATPAKDGFMSKEDKAKLDGVNNYTHPSTHAATMITEDSTHRFVTDAEKTKWDNKADNIMASKTNAGLMSASDKQRIDGLNAEFKTRDDKITKNTEDIKSWNDEMINKEYQYFNGENITIDNSIVSKTTDMIIKGRTLQNLIKQGNETFVIDKSVNENSRIKVFKTVYPLEIGKVYKGYLIVKNIENAKRLSIYGYSSGNTTEAAYGSSSLSNNLGLINFTWIPTNNNGMRFFDTIGLYIENTEFNNGGKATFSDFMLFEENTDISSINNYFEGINSFAQENKISILSHSKNLLKPPSSDITKRQGTCDITLTKDGGFIINGSNSTTGGGRHLFSDIYFYKVKRGVSYTLSCVHVSGTSTDQYSPTLFLTNINNHSDIPASINTISSTKKATFIADKDMILFCGVNVNIGQSYNNFNIKVMLEEGDNATQYEVYKENKKDIVIKEPLRGFNKNIYDVIYEDNGQVKIDKYSNQYTFTGDEAFKGFETDGVYSKCTLADFNIKLGTTNILCNNFAYSVDRPALENQYEFISSVNSSLYSIVLCIKSSRLSTNNLEGYKAWLKANPTSIVYQLAEPTVEVLENYVDINLKTYSEKTYITSDNVIQGNLGCRVPMNTAANLENDSNRLNNVEDYIKSNKNNIDKISKLEEGAVTSSLNIIDLQKEIKNDNNYIHYEGSNITIDNLSKDSRTSNITIKGQTLFNAVITPMINKTYNGNSTQQMYNYKVVRKPNTLYTIIALISQNTLNNNFSLISWNRTSNNQPIIISSGEKGLIKRSFTTNSNTEDWFFEMWRESTTGSITIDYIMVLEGDWTNKDVPKYFEGIKSFGEKNSEQKYAIDILSSGKNLYLDKDIIICKPENKWRVLDISIPRFEIGKKYRLSYSCNHEVELKIILTYADGHDRYISSLDYIGIEKGKGDITRVRLYIEDSVYNTNKKFIITNIQIEEGITSSQYDKYKEDKKTILTKEPLRSLYEYKDILHSNNSKAEISRYIGEHIFTGNETMKEVENNSKAVIVSVAGVKGLDDRNFISNQNIGYDVRWNVNEWENSYPIAFNFANSENGNIVLLFSKTRMPFITSIDSIKKYLRENNLQIIYKLAEPTVETLENYTDINLTVFKDKTYVTSSNSIKGEISFSIPNNLISQTKENTDNLNKGLNSINSIKDKTCKLEEAQLSTALNVLELQKHTSMLSNGEINEYKDHSGLYVKCTNTLNSRTENMLIKGITLHNIHKKQNYSFHTNLNSESYDVSLSGNSCEVKIKNYESGKYYYISGGLIDFSLLKPNTVYSVIADATDGLNPCIRTPSYTDPLTKTSTVFKNGVATITTNDLSTGYKEQVLYVNLRTDLLNEFQRLKNAMILEGDWTNRNIPEYFEEIRSLGEAECNILSEEQILPGYIGGSDGITLNLLSSNIDDGTRIIIVPCESDTTYTITKEIMTDRFIIGTTTEKPISGMKVTKLFQNANTKSATIKTPINAKYLLAYVTVNTNEKPCGKININKSCKTKEWSTPNKYKINVLSHNKNLIDFEEILNDFSIPYTIEDGGYKVTANAKFYRGFFYPKNPINQYSISLEVKALSITNFRFEILYSDGTISSTQLINSSNNFEKIEVTSTLGKTISYIRMNWTSAGDLIIKNLQIEEGKITLFEKYKETNTSILIKEPLRGIKNIFDIIYEDYKYIKVNRSLGKYTFTGDENFRLSNGGWENKTSVTTFEGFKLPNWNPINLQNNSENLVCNSLRVNSFNDQWNGSAAGIEGITSHSVGGIVISIDKNKLSTQDTEGLKAWLKANPTTVIYQLANPVVENIESVDINVDTYKDKTYITTDNEIQGELEFKTQNNFGAIMKNVNRCISKIFNSLNNILNIKGE